MVPFDVDKVIHKRWYKRERGRHTRGFDTHECPPLVVPFGASVLEKADVCNALDKKTETSMSSRASIIAESNSKDSPPGGVLSKLLSRS